MINIGDIYCANNKEKSVLSGKVLVIVSMTPSSGISSGNKPRRPIFNNFKLRDLNYDYCYWAYLEKDGTFSFQWNNSGLDTMESLHKIGSDYKLNRTEYVLYGNNRYSYEFINKALKTLKE